MSGVRGDFWLFFAVAPGGKTVFLRLFNNRPAAEDTAAAARAGGYEEVNVVALDVERTAVRVEPIVQKSQ